MTNEEQPKPVMIPVRQRFNKEGHGATVTWIPPNKLRSRTRWGAPR